MEGRPSGGAWRVQGAPVAGLPIGFRFRPTDEELLLHYLRRKALDCPLPAGVIPDADLARLHPSDLLPHPAGGGDADGERFFFHRPATRCWRKGGGGARAAGGDGVWRSSGKEKLVVSPRCRRPVGTKRTLVFCHGRGRRAARTGWAMHEYRLLPDGLHPFHGCAAAGGNPPNAHVPGHGAAADWVVCRIFRKTKPAAAHRGREDDEEEEMPSTPSSASSCVTDTSETGEQEQDEEEESSSSSNGGGSSCSVASN